jgi:hypothetical protein
VKGVVGADMWDPHRFELNQDDETKETGKRTPKRKRKKKKKGETTKEYPTYLPNR